MLFFLYHATQWVPSPDVSSRFSIPHLFLIYEIETEDFYQDIADDIEETFDTSDFPEDHPSNIPTGKNKKVIGMLKDETGGKIIEEFIGLRAKLYSYKMFEDLVENKKV